MVQDPREITVIDLLGDNAPLDVSETDVAYGPTFACRKNVTYAFEYQFTSEGAVDAKIEIEQGNSEPGTEMAEDDNFVVPEDAPDFDTSITDKNKHIKAYTPAVSKFLRPKITGQGLNAATTKLSVFKVMLEKNL